MAKSDRQNKENKACQKSDEKTKAVIKKSKNIKSNLQRNRPLVLESEIRKEREE